MALPFSDKEQEKIAEMRAGDVVVRTAAGTITAFGAAATVAAGAQADKCG